MDELNKRIVEIMMKFNHSKSSLAHELGVSLPLITHITSGRNKPGIDFLQKVLTSFKDLDPYWLFLGEGQMLKSKPKQLDVKPLLDNLAGLDQLVNQAVQVNNTTLAYHKLLFDEIMHLKEMSTEISDANQDLAKLKQQIANIKVQVSSLIT